MNLHNCGPSQMCQNTVGADSKLDISFWQVMWIIKVGGFKCVDRCSEGYEYVDGECVDIDECRLENVCDRRAECINTPGAYECKCDSGLTGDGKHCTRELGPITLSRTLNPYVVQNVPVPAITDCSQQEDICDRHAFCIKSLKLCICQTGYVGDGITCNDVNECDSMENPCENQEGDRCVNIKGGYICCDNDVDDDRCIRGDASGGDKVSSSTQPSSGEKDGQDGQDKTSGSTLVGDKANATTRDPVQPESNEVGLEISYVPTKKPPTEEDSHGGPKVSVDGEGSGDDLTKDTTGETKKKGGKVVITVSTATKSPEIIESATGFLERGGKIILEKGSSGSFTSVSEGFTAGTHDGSLTGAGSTTEEPINGDEVGLEIIHDGAKGTTTPKVEVGLEIGPVHKTTASPGRPKIITETEPNDSKETVDSDRPAKGTTEAPVSTSTEGIEASGESTTTGGTSSVTGSSPSFTASPTTTESIESSGDIPSTKSESSRSTTEQPDLVLSMGKPQERQPAPSTPSSEESGATTGQPDLVLSMGTEQPDLVLSMGTTTEAVTTSASSTSESITDAASESTTEPTSTAPTTTEGVKDDGSASTTVELPSSTGSPAPGASTTTSESDTLYYYAVNI
ncbi:EGF-like domain protein [Ancylostoma ceylanicum]|uniref:EGF-like domain protein n=1 Tax=Ancylostoma ceylanicum TaxID=53326 RepID=A0A0D6MD14_9BILA|nr:EGF-like domain protein [Ancylostoma ceylanicum]